VKIKEKVRLGVKQNKTTKIKTNKMKKQIISEQFRRMQLLAGIITEGEYRESINENVDKLLIRTGKSDDGNTQIVISIAGRGLDGNEIILSEPEYKELLKMAKTFAGNRNSELSKGVNTPDKMNTQSIVGIKPEGLKLSIYRKESFGGNQRYKGYDSPYEGGELTAMQSVIYQLADEDK